MRSSLRADVLIVGCAIAGVARGASLPCEGLIDIELADTKITSAVSVSAGRFAPGGDVAYDNVPAFCRVVGIASPTVGFEVWLPPRAAWNGRFMGVGNAGAGGSIFYGPMPDRLRRGYVVAGTDGGHTGDIFSFAWAPGRPDLVEEFGSGAVHKMTVRAKAIIHAYYGESARHSFFSGCSSGGRQALVEAQRYPDDFDGIIFGAPTIYFTDLYAGAHMGIAQGTLKDPDSHIPASKLPLLAAAVDAACDRLDGIRDGVLNDPRDCKFDASTLLCGPAQDPTACFTPKQVTAITTIWSGTRNSAGELIYPPLLPGGEAAKGPGSWTTFVTGTAPLTAAHYTLAVEFFRHVVFEDPDWDWRTFNVDKDAQFAKRKLSASLDAADPDLRAFKRRGGKMIGYHGWNDPDISPLATINYYEDVVRMAAGTGDSDARSGAG